MNDQGCILKLVMNLVEKGLIPDFLVRSGINKLNQIRLEEISFKSEAEKNSKVLDHVNILKTSPQAIETQKANEQHYELPPEFFVLTLGERKKYSCCYFPVGNETLDQAELASLNQIIERADLHDGQDILELGCGWGSLSLYLAEKFPNSNITAVSNSKPQRLYIEDQSNKRGFTNLTVITCDINQLDFNKIFDRIVSIEMFEHVRNYQMLFERLNRWLRPEGKLFFHVFCHKNVPYLFEDKNDDDWMTRYFFLGGQMPSKDLFLEFSNKFELLHQWTVNGNHYAKTSELWLLKMDKNKKRILEIFRSTYGGDFKIWWNRWRVFYLACAEFFAFNHGEEWHVVHYLFLKPKE